MNNERAKKRIMEKIAMVNEGSEKAFLRKMIHRENYCYISKYLSYILYCF